MPDIIDKGLFLQVGENHRVESSPIRGSGPATAERLKTLHPHYTVGGLDALGKVIKLNENFNYIDWKNTAQTWVVYARNKFGRYVPVSSYPDRLTAIDAAVTLANKETN